MVGDDHLDKETSVSVEITPTGVKAAAKSRLVAAADRLVGNFAEWANVRLEADSSIRRAKMEGEVRMIEAAAQYGIERMGKDPAFADRAIQNHFRQVLGHQENRDGVLAEAIEDLRRDPPSDDQSEAGGEELEPEFMDRLDQYAGTASTAELKQKWGRVLAAEVRRPGTFSRKVLRVIDELEPETARLFEELCQHRVGDILPACLVEPLDFSKTARLVGSGLLEDAGFGGLQREYRQVTLPNGESLWFLPIVTLGVALPFDADIGHVNILEEPNASITLSDGKPGLPVHVLTPVGQAVSSILPDHQMSAFTRLHSKINAVIPTVFAYRRTANLVDWERFSV